MLSFDDPAFLGSMVDPLWIVAGAAPIVDLPLARNRSLTDVISGQNLIPFGRVGNGTYVDSDRILKTGGTNAPLFDHDPATGESLGLLAEGQFANLVTRSQELSDAAWNKLRITTTENAVIAPDGTLSADRLTEDTANGTHTLTRSSGTTVAANTLHTGSVFVKAGERTVSRFAVFNNAFANGARVNVDMVAGTAVIESTLGAATSVSTAIEAWPDGWFRVWLSLLIDNSSTQAQIQLLLRNASGQVVYTGDGSSGLFAWGFQLQAGSITSYAPTTNSAVTRNADFADLIDAAIANNIRTLYLEFRSPAVGTRGVASLNDNTANERASVITSGTDPRLVVVDGGVQQANINGGTITAGTRTRVAVRIGANDFAMSVNGGAVVTDTSGTLPTVNRLMLGRTQAGEWLNGRLARVTGWSELLPDATMQALSQ